MVAAVIGAALLTIACSEPPQKEIDRAQGAIDAARAAGADQYAPEPFAAATAAMQQTHEAVRQRDYRLALSRAIDANDRALEAARQAASGKARARSEAEAAIAWLSTATRQLADRIKAAEAARVPARELDPAKRTRDEANRTLQEARTAVAGEDYLRAQEGTKALAERITEQTSAVNQAIDARTARGPRRKR
jgi:hypothetical protein